MKCIVVGNGTSLLDKANGSRIDSHDTVVRFNAYTTKDFEAHTGVRTTRWFNVINFQDPEDFRIKAKYDRVYVHSWQWDSTKDKLFLAFRNYFPAALLIKTTRADLDGLVAYAQTPQYRSYSTGAIAIWMLLREFPQLTLTGFDWWDRQEHHYNDKAARGTLHKPQIERLFIDKLLAEGKVVFL